jgi:hypothetical protein
MIELFPGFNLSLDIVIALMIKVMMVLIAIVGLVMVRQAGLMNKVVSLPVGKGFVVIAWGFAIVCWLLTAIVVIAG